MAVKNREDWLARVAKGMEKWFDRMGSPLGDYAVTCGFPSKGALAAKSRSIGQCWSPEASSAKLSEIFVSPLLDDPVEVAQVLCHELLHAAVGVEAGHKGPFVKGCKVLGLEGKPTATVAGDLFRANVAPILAKVGEYPHKKMDPTVGAKKQTTRMIKVSCPLCEDEEPYIVRMTRKNIERGCPVCPFHETEMVPDEGSLANAG